MVEINVFSKRESERFIRGEIIKQMQSLKREIEQLRRDLILLNDKVRIFKYGKVKGVY